jgi:tetratricopeptide (TPR) repeat protein
VSSDPKVEIEHGVSRESVAILRPWVTTWRHVVAIDPSGDAKPLWDWSSMLVAFMRGEAAVPAPPLADELLALWPDFAPFLFVEGRARKSHPGEAMEFLARASEALPEPRDGDAGSIAAIAKQIAADALFADNGIFLETRVVDAARLERAARRANHVRTWVDLANAFVRRDRDDRARDCLAAARALCDTVGSNAEDRSYLAVAQARILERAGKHDDALTTLREAWKTDRQFYALFSLVEMLMTDTSDGARARAEDVVRLVDLDATDPQTNEGSRLIAWRAQALAQLGRQDEARAVLKRIETTSPFYYRQTLDVIEAAARANPGK